MSEFAVRRAPVLVGLTVGLALGLLYTWVIAPVELVNTYPALMRIDHRHDWIRMAALSYAADGDLARARYRLDGLRREDVADALQALIEEYAATGRPADTLRRLTTLAQALDVHTPAMLVYLHTPAPTRRPTRTPTPTQPPTLHIAPSLPSDTPEPTLTPTPYTSSPLPTPTPEVTGTVPTITPTPTPPLPARLRLSQREQICEPSLPLRIEIVVKDEQGEQVPGVAVWLMWLGGADRAVTGLKPDRGAGYADFAAEPDVSYSLGTSELGMPLVAGLRIESCPAQGDEEPPLGSWRILLQPPLATDEPTNDDGR